MLPAERVRRMAADEELRAHLEERELARQAELEAVEAGTGAAAMLQSAVEAEASGKVKVEPAEQMYVPTLTPTLFSFAALIETAPIDWV